MGLATRWLKALMLINFRLRVITGFSVRQLAWYGWYRFRRAPRIVQSGINVRTDIDAGFIEKHSWRAPEFDPEIMCATFLNIKRCLNFPEDWYECDAPRLWTYKLHYFDDLRSDSSDEHIHAVGNLFDRWILENPIGYGPGWEPYPLSLRLYNLIQWLLISPGERTESRILSLTAQARYLRRSLEHHVGGNHLWANAKALIATSYFFDDLEAREWNSRGTKLLLDCIRDQIDIDGSHIELSPMYQALLLEDLCDLLDLEQILPGTMNYQAFIRIRSTATAMGEWLRFMCHPDGFVSFFNDTNFDMAPKPKDLLGRLKTHGIILGSGTNNEQFCTRGGFTRMIKGEWCLIADTAPPGSRRVPGHIHADSLSFELSLGDERVVVNGGMSTYDPGRKRLLERSTRNHSTIEINGKNSSAVTESFRTGRLAHTKVKKLTRRGDDLEVAATHDGYRCFGFGPYHKRTWRLGSNGLLVTDLLLSGNVSKARFRLHLSPTLKVIKWTDGVGLFRLPSGRILEFKVSERNARLKHYRFKPRFYSQIRNNVIEVMVGRHHELVVSAKKP